MWTVNGEPEHFPDGRGTDGYAGEWCKWWLDHGEDETFTVVKAPAHVLMGAGDLTERTVLVTETRGRSEVERHLGAEVPPRVIELHTGSREPTVTQREARVR